ncbi:MAG: (2Fe-2S)-binding protein, partial [Oscillospiraceae bacterium]|nr:(2Fe-2S)-binding protein [Oscillospiraceae bacterium]
MSDMVNVKINGFAVQVPKGTSVLEAARAASVTIPTLCYLKDINEIGACRMCMVEANEGRGFRLVAACVYPVSEGMEVLTNSPKVLDSRRKTMELLLSNHDMKCLSCVRSKNCELQKLANDLGITNADTYKGERTEYAIDDSAPHMFRDNNKCILCRRCVAACAKTQGIGVIGANERG